MEKEEFYQAFRIPQKSWWILLSPNGEWGMYKNDKFTKFDSVEHAMPLLPLLELPHAEVMKLVQDGSRRINVNSGAIRDFPYDLLLCRALTWPTEYWPSLALKWLEEGYPVTPQLASCLTEVIGKCVLPQRVIVRAYHVLQASNTTPLKSGDL